MGRWSRLVAPRFVNFTDFPERGTGCSTSPPDRIVHCRGGPGTDQFDKMAVIGLGREEGIAHAQILAEHVTTGQVDMTRPLCPYPQVAVYKGSGATNARGILPVSSPDRLLRSRFRRRGRSRKHSSTVTRNVGVTVVVVPLG